MADEANTPNETPATDDAEAAAAAAATAAAEAAVAAAANASHSDVVIGDAPLTGAALIDTLDKDQLEAYARENFQRELDKRKRLDALRTEVKALLDGSTQRAEAAEAAEAAKVEARAAGTPVRARHKYLRDKLTGEPFEFEWNPLYAKNSDLEPIYED